jgi:hypothetical protein
MREFPLLVLGIVSLCAAFVQAAPFKSAPLAPHVTGVAARNVVSKSALLIPQLLDAPAIDGKRETLWEKATTGELQYAPATLVPHKADTHFRVGHHGNVLYLLLKFDWPKNLKPVANATQHDTGIDRDDGAEIFFAAPDDLNTSQQFMFNLAGVRGDNTFLLNGKDINYLREWNPQWKLATAFNEEERAWFAEIEVPLAEIPTVRAGIGEVFRFDIVRNAVAHGKRLSHWSPTSGQFNGRPKDFGFAVLTGADSQQFRWQDIPSRHRSQLVIADKTGDYQALNGYPIALNVFNPLASLVKNAPRDLLYTLKNEKGIIVKQGKLSVATWPHTLTIQPPNMRDSASGSTLLLELSAAADRQKLFKTLIHWKPTRSVNAADLTTVKVAGDYQVRIYPRGVNRDVLVLQKGARATLDGEGRAIYVDLPPYFAHPGPRLTGTSLLESKFRYRIDGGVWKNLAILDLAHRVALAENLPAQTHRIELETTDSSVFISGFTFSNQALAGIQGKITANAYTELLMDVRLDTLAVSGKTTRVLRSDYVRNPANNRFNLWGLKAGQYRFRFTASGWQTYETQTISLKAGQKIDLGIVALRQLPALADFTYYSSFNGLGKAVSVAPGESFKIPFTGGSPTAALVSRYKTIPLKITATWPGNINQSAQAEFEVPLSAPHDIYTLRLNYNGYLIQFPQAVCVREALPAEFHIAGVSHMNTWGQESSEYLARVAETVQLAGARTLLIGNEVNAAYIAGALQNVRIPYLVTLGNHTMAHWKDFFGPRTHALDDGPMRIVTFNDAPDESWSDVLRLAQERPEATNRILLAFEAYAPLEVIQQGKLGLLFDGHKYREHPQQEQFPSGTLHIRANDYQSVRWIAMNHQGLDADYRSAYIPAFQIPREDLSPLRAEYSTPNDGSSTWISANVINQTALPFPHARLRFVLRERTGGYKVSGAQLLQEFVSDDGKTRVIDVQMKLKPNSKLAVKVLPAT